MEPTFGERLTDWLKFVGMRQADLARALDISRRVVHAWVHDDSPPTTDRLVPIVKALGISGGVSEFFARMPTLEADTADEEEPARAHPATGDTTRAEWCPRCGSRLGAHHEPCASCGHLIEAA